MTGLTPQMPVQPSRLLLIDDDRSLAALITEYCGSGGFSITAADTGEDGIRLAQQQYFLLIILDVMLPGIDGFEVLRRIRYSSNTPILMLTTRGAAKDRIHGLESGADDYLPKPFQPEELLARIQSILRRVHPRENLATFTLGDLTVNNLERSITLEGRPLDLTGAEFHLLKVLLSQPGMAVSREELVRRIFGREPSGLDRSVDNLVNNLRKKIGAHANGKDRFKSIRNVGYCYICGNDGATAP
ncbi:response regulator transcription factor [Granulicella mallensis]|uniref:DNA-binding response OmpR family regulator n=1 Tax=Granulicella mallensis TaxID=940614 RepID=A0A7W7ZN06_9BACT|nr:response regulator transcription factor [Granulicella mallensis]MBB5062887.1 DNA-binding response OmpR family regulator [Granulicella mallensis]